jgi:UDP-glucose 4-epimerase
VCFFNVYGPYFDPEGPYALVIGKFLKQSKNNEPLTIRGDGTMCRDYTYVDDVVRGTIAAMQTPGVAQGEVINLGFGHAHSVNEVAQLIGGKTIFIPTLPGEMKFTQANTAKAKKLLKWQPKISLEEGIRRLKNMKNM